MCFRYRYKIDTDTDIGVSTVIHTVLDDVDIDDIHKRYTDTDIGIDIHRVTDNTDRRYIDTDIGDADI